MRTKPCAVSESYLCRPPVICSAFRETLISRSCGNRVMSGLELYLGMGKPVSTQRKWRIWISSRAYATSWWFRSFGGLVQLPSLSCCFNSLVEWVPISSRKAHCFLADRIRQINVLTFYSSILFKNLTGSQPGVNGLNVGKQCPHTYRISSKTWLIFQWCRAGFY
jgi:hypothetical protein